ncbi:acetyl-CoA carboxylase biotin carboxyl carrier protein subunit [Anaerocellum diazotrophicum]|uniref:Biotin carboxyl carrier protein n=1 Tax=Caldicellulosiruptor diazotrophicus TaxID=2806205 RepID=A0ABN6EAX7_9FIRM|nr:acetyl-CoA carboxylase biotin carboxyl carrier protein subunit [Caldicellulosiruptor diazotrophicus]BCS81229.1 biotin carboxyl carrier protein [Caldicellulosiruptor diazotrophicus]
MRKFKVKINSQEFVVEVEEIRVENATPVVPRPKISHFEPKQERYEDKVKQSSVPSSDKNSVVAQLPGTIVRLLKSEGDVVDASEPVLILEAMKMENEITAPVNGKIKKIHVKEGQKVAKGDLLFEIE